MNEAEWLDQMREGTGPLSIDTIESIQPDPELLILVRDLIHQLGSDEETLEHPADPYLPLIAIIVAGLVRDAESVPLLMGTLRQAHIEDWDMVTSNVPWALGSIGGPAVEIALARLLEIEMNPETDPSYPYFYWDMITVLQKAAIEDQEIREQFLEMVQQRITSPDIDPFIKEVWASHIIDIADERVGDIIESFYDSASPDSQFEMIGDRKMARDTWQRQFEEPLETGARSLIRSYQMIRNYILEDMNQEPEEELPVPGSTVQIDDAPRLGSSATFYGEIQEPFVREESKIGRNDPCPCGSGKKYKKCHGRE